MSGLTTLHKILKDEKRQKIITLLNEKSSSYTDLMEDSEILSTGLLNYHLKVLGDLIQKNESGLYILTEKGKLAYRVLSEFPDGQPQVIDKRIYKSWVIFTLASVIIAILNSYFLHISIERTALLLTILLLCTGFAFYIRIKPSHSGNRVFFIAIGTLGIGGIFWASVTLLILHSGLRWAIQNATGNIGDDLFALATLIICWILGGFVGDWIGRKRNYAVPMLRV